MRSLGIGDTSKLIVCLFQGICFHSIVIFSIVIFSSTRDPHMCLSVHIGVGKTAVSTSAVGSHLGHGGAVWPPPHMQVRSQLKLRAVAAQPATCSGGAT